MRDQGVQIQKLQNAMRAERARSAAMSAAKSQLRGEPQRRLLAFVGVSSHPSRGALRTALRNSWFPTGEALAALEQEQGIVLRFVLGEAPADQAVGKFTKQARARQAPAAGRLRLTALKRVARHRTRSAFMSCAPQRWRSKWRRTTTYCT